MARTRALSPEAIKAAIDAIEATIYSRVRDGGNEAEVSVLTPYFAAKIELEAVP